MLLGLLGDWKIYVWLRVSVAVYCSCTWVFCGQSRNTEYRCHHGEKMTHSQNLPSGYLHLLPRNGGNPYYPVLLPCANSFRCTVTSRTASATLAPHARPLTLIILPLEHFFLLYSRYPTEKTTYLSHVFNQKCSLYVLYCSSVDGRETEYFCCRRTYTVLVMYPSAMNRCR